MSMQLNIVNQKAPSFNESIGISEDRANQLGALLDQLSRKLQGQVVHTCDLFNEIAGFCNNPEELVFCTISHTNYMAIKFGIYLCPLKNRSNG